MRRTCVAKPMHVNRESGGLQPTIAIGPDDRPRFLEDRVPLHVARV